MSAAGRAAERPRRMPSWLVVALIVVGLVVTVFGATRFTDRLDDSGRPVYGWTLVLIFGGFWVIGGSIILWKRSRGERSRLEDI